VSMPAEITSTYDWDRLIVTLRAQFRSVDALYERITERDTEQQQPDRTEPMTDVQQYPEPGYDADDRAAELADEERMRLDAETDGRLDGDHTRDDDLDLDL
jgi:hypothetical protein